MALVVPYFQRLLAENAKNIMTEQPEELVSVSTSTTDLVSDKTEGVNEGLERSLPYQSPR